MVYRNALEDVRGCKLTLYTQIPQYFVWYTDI